VVIRALGNTNRQELWPEKRRAKNWPVSSVIYISISPPILLTDFPLIPPRGLQLISAAFGGPAVKC
jgi:hypothetical protein